MQISFSFYLNTHLFPLCTLNEIYIPHQESKKALICFLWPDLLELSLLPHCNHTSTSLGLLLALVLFPGLESSCLILIQLAASCHWNLSTKDSSLETLFLVT